MALEKDLSTDAKLTVQGLLDRLQIRVSPEGAKYIFDNPACGELIQPMVSMLRSKMLLDKVIVLERNCQDMLLEYIKYDSEVEDPAGEGIRNILGQDKDTLVAMSADLSALESTLDGYFEGVFQNDTILEQLQPLRQDLSVLINLVADMKSELKLSSGGSIELMGESLPAKILGALHNPKYDSLIEDIVEDLQKEFDFKNELTPLKQALLVSLLGVDPKQAREQAQDPHVRGLIHEIMTSKAVEKMERLITQDPMVYKNLKDFAREFSSTAKPDLKDVHNELLDTYKKFAALQVKIEDHREQWGKIAGAHDLKKPVEDTPMPEGLASSR